MVHRIPIPGYAGETVDFVLSRAMNGEYGCVVRFGGSETKEPLITSDVAVEKLKAGCSCRVSRSSTNCFWSRGRPASRAWLYPLMIVEPCGERQPPVTSILKSQLFGGGPVTAAVGHFRMQSEQSKQLSIRFTRDGGASVVAFLVNGESPGLRQVKTACQKQCSVSKRLPSGSPCRVRKLGKRDKFYKNALPRRFVEMLVRGEVWQDALLPLG